MNGIKTEEMYRTSDKAVYYGKDALKRAKAAQKQIDFNKDIKNLLPEVYKILDIDTTCGGDNEDNTLEKEEDIAKRVNETLCTDCTNIEELLHDTANIYFEVPELVKIFNLIDKRFNK